MKHTSQIAMWMLTYVCIVIRNRRCINRDLWIIVWKYFKMIVFLTKHGIEAMEHPPL